MNFHDLKEHSLYPNFSNSEVSQPSILSEKKLAHFRQVLEVTELIVSGTQGSSKKEEMSFEVAHHGCNSFFYKHTALAIMRILASEDLLR